MSWPNKDLPDLTPNCRVRIIAPLHGVFPELQPEVGKIYDAHFVEGIFVKARGKHYSFVIIPINGKQVVVRKEEFEVVEWLE